MDIKKRILIADDSAINRDMLSEFLSEQYIISLAVDGEEAIRVLENKAQEIDLLLLDIQMPKKNGFDVLQFMQMHGLLQRIPVIVIAASNAFEDEMQAYTFGASEIIHKPFNFEIVEHRIKNQLELFSRRMLLEEQLDRSQKALIDRESFDPLTKLFTKERFLTEVDEILCNEDAENSITKYCISYINIRYFKVFNHNYGMDSGDAMLKFLATTIKRLGRKENRYARFGDDHFVIFSRIDRADQFFEAISKLFQKRFGSHGLQLKCGVYQIKHQGIDVSIACDYARIACDAVRNSEENYCLYSDEIQYKLETDSYVIQHLDEAIAKNYIKVYYQPVIRSLTTAVCGMEALSRWIDPVHGFLSPADFIPVLEEEGQIYKIDQHVIREVCRTVAEAEKNGTPMVPISVNLSRMDFFQFDVVEYIESVTREFNVARDMLNLEITESVVMDEQKIVTNCVTQLRELGYQVWMDDFGSGYSSLNVLKDFQFDEVKLDREFMWNFDTKSQNILASIVSMCKKLGIPTLAEGVETEEQMEFLQSIGCDKIQGFLISKPLPMEELRENNDRKIETRFQQTYYDGLRNLDFVTDQTFAVAEFDGAMFDILYANDAFRHVWGSTGLSAMKKTYNTETLKGSDYWKRFKSYLAGIKMDGKFREMDYTYGQTTVRLRCRVISEYQNSRLFQIELINLTKMEGQSISDTEGRAINELLRSVHDLILMWDLKEKTVKEVSKNEFSAVGTEFAGTTPEECIAKMEEYIYREDQEGFLQFMDLSRIEDRIKNSIRGFVAGYFRTKVSSGAYIWKIHFIVRMPGTDEYMYMSKVAPLDQPGLLEKMGAITYTGDHPLTLEVLWNNMVRSDTISFFWKDKERRFLGANHHFLQTYGLKSVKEIEGKTDEDMGWHTDNAPFRDDEYRVLFKGETIRNRIGRCIIRGVEHSILVHKEPLYDSGEIVGLWGYFIVLENVVVEAIETGSLQITDPETGVMTTHGAVPVVFEYIEGWNIRHEDFAVITLDIPRYKNGVDTYGQELMNQMMAEVARVVKEQIGTSGSCVRLYGGTLVIYNKVTDRADINALMKNISENVSAIHQVNNYPVTVRPELSVSYASDAIDMQDLLWKSMILAVFHDMESFTKNYREREVMNSVLDQLPCSVGVYRYSADNQLTRLYISDHAKKLYYSGETYTSDMSEIMSLVHPDDSAWVQRRVNECLQSRSDMNEVYRIISKTGELHWISHKSHAVLQKDGSCLNYAIYTDVTEQKLMEESKKEKLTEHYGKYYKKDFDAGNMGQLMSVIDFQEEVMNGIAKNYVAMYIVNVQENNYMKVFCMEYLEKMLEPHTTAQDTLNKIIESTITAESQAEAKAYMDFTTLAERVEGKNSVILDFNGKFTGWCRCSILPITYDDRGDLKEVIICVEHIQDEKIKEEQLKLLSETDSLTKLYNRAAGESRINEYLSNHQEGMFCLFDIDNFKRCNDNYGHEVGDDIIRKVAESMRAVFRKNDILMRYGGDEFVIFAPGIVDNEYGENRIMKLAETIEQKTTGYMREKVTISAGVIYTNEDEYREFNQMCKIADTLMYSRKRQKKFKHHVTDMMQLSDEMPCAMLIYLNNPEEKIVYASKGLVELFDCANMDEFMTYTKGSFKNIVHPDDYERVEKEITEQIIESGEKRLDHVFYDIISAKGKRKAIDDYGHLVDSKQYGEAYYVVLTEKME